MDTCYGRGRSTPSVLDLTQYRWDFGCCWPFEIIPATSQASHLSFLPEGFPLSHVLHKCRRHCSRPPCGAFLHFPFGPSHAQRIDPTFACGLIAAITWSASVACKEERRRRRRRRIHRPPLEMWVQEEKMFRGSAFAKEEERKEKRKKELGYFKRGCTYGKSNIIYQLIF